jgi:glycosyltransferase involved in cell wall biosynthesis
MRIAINAAGAGEDDSVWLLLNTLCDQQHEHELLLFSDADTRFPVNDKIHVYTIGQPVTSLLSKRWWLDVKLPAELKKHRPDVLLNITGDASLRTIIPQLLFINEMVFLQHPKLLSSAEVLFRKFYLPKYVKTVKAVVVPSAQLKEDLITQYKKPADKIIVIPPITPATYEPLEWEEKEKLKTSYTEGNEYFLFSGGYQLTGNIITVLKAFSQFKKWQKSSMKLVISGETSNNEIAEKIKRYRFRDDVVVINKVNTAFSAQLMASAYAYIHTPLYDASGRSVIEAMQSATPVIASDLPVIHEVGGDAVLYASPQNEEMIAEQMIKLHKDEELRTRLIQAGKKQAEKYPGSASAMQLLQLIESES